MCDKLINLCFLQITLGNRNTHAEFDDMKAHFFEEMSPAIEWNELARKICKRNEENKLTNQQVLDEIDDSEDDYDEEETSEQSNESNTSENSDVVSDKKEETTKKPVTSTKAPKEKSTAKPKSTTSAPPSVVDSNNENDESEADEDYNYSEEDDDDDEDREDESILPVEKPDQKNKILLDGIKVIKEFDSRIFGNFINKNIF